MTLKFIKNVESLKNWTICVPSFKIFFGSIMLDWNWSTKMLLFLSSSFSIESTKPWVPTLYHTHHFPKIPAQWFSMILQCWIKIDTPRGWFYTVAWHLDMLIHLGLSPKGLDFFSSFAYRFFRYRFFSWSVTGNATQVFQKQVFQKQVFQIQIFHNPKRKKTNPKSKIQIKNQNVEKLQALWAKYQSWNHKKKLQSLAHKRVWQKFGGKSQKALEKNLRECCLHLLGLREAAPTANNTKYFTRHFELKWLIRSTKHLVYKHHLYEATPNKKWNTKNEKQQAQWAKYQSWNHQKRCKGWLINAFGKRLEDTPKRRWKKSREFCLHSYVRERVRLPQNIQYCACHLVS